MKPLSETYKKLGIAFTFPIIIKDANGKLTYYGDSEGFWARWELDANGIATYYENSNGYWRRSKLDAEGNETYFEDSEGYKRGTPKSTNQ